MNIIVEIISITIAFLLWLLLFRNTKESTEESTTSTNPIEVYVEKIGECYYAWHEKTFMFQSKDAKEVIVYIKNKFPNTIIKITSDKELTWLQEIKKEMSVH